MIRERAAATVRVQVELAGEPAAQAAQALTSNTTSTKRPTRPCRGVLSWCSTSADQCGFGRVLMRADDGGVSGNVPVDLTRRVGRGLDLVEQTFPGSVR